MYKRQLFTFEQSIEEKQLEVKGLENAGPQNVYGDQDLLHQVIYNLVENAVKFTNQGGYIKLQISDGIDRTSVVIENSGPGISPEELPIDVYKRQGEEQAFGTESSSPDNEGSPAGGQEAGEQEESSAGSMNGMSFDMENGFDEMDMSKVYQLSLIHI